jgi:hypothetical protein
MVMCPTRPQPQADGAISAGSMAEATATRILDQKGIGLSISVRRKGQVNGRRVSVWDFVY